MTAIKVNQTSIGNKISFYKQPGSRTNLYVGAQLLHALGINPNKKLFILLDVEGPKLFIRPLPEKIENSRELLNGRVSFPETVLRKYVDDSAKKISVLARADRHKRLITADFRDAL